MKNVLAAFAALVVCACNSGAPPSDAQALVLAIHTDAGHQPPAIDSDGTCHVYIKEPTAVEMDHVEAGYPDLYALGLSVEFCAAGISEGVVIPGLGAPRFADTVFIRWHADCADPAPTTVGCQDGNTVTLDPSAYLPNVPHLIELTLGRSIWQVVESQ